MSVGTFFRLAIGLSSVALASPALTQSLPNANHPGKAAFDKTCAACHAAPTDGRTPTLATLAGMTGLQLRGAISEGGTMAPMAAALSEDERTQLIAYLTSGQRPTATDWTATIMCPVEKRSVDVNKSVVSNGFSVDSHQSRSLSATQAGIKKNQLKNLEIAWTIGFPGQGSGTGATTVGDTVFITGGGRLAAVDASTGCVKWSYSVNTRNTPAFGDIAGRKVIALSAGRDVLVVDAKTGEKVWQANGQSTDNPGSIRGGVVIYKDKVIVPISASGVGAGGRATFECCTGHGAVVALSAKDGSKLWEYHTMPTATYNGLVSSTGVKQRGPSGAPIWSIPLIDEKRNRVIVTTGENTSHPGTDTSDAVIALDLDTGKRVWHFQAMEFDIWNMACRDKKENSGPNCPWNIEGDTGSGRDFDFGAGAALVENVNGKDVILAGQKSGHVWALDAEDGKKLWSVQYGEGTALGGVHWGIATDGERVFAAISDPGIAGARRLRPGVFGVDIKTGKEAWAYEAKPNCDGERGRLVKGCSGRFGFSAAPLVVDGAVIAATLGAEVMILDGKTGELLNRLDTLGPKETINGIDAAGGSIDSHAISAGAGMIFINSGYGSFNQTPGNAFIAYRPKK